MLRTVRQQAGFAGRRGWLLLILATLPAAPLGALGRGVIKTHLFGTTTVAIGWGVGGIAILLVEWYRPTPGTAAVDDLTWRQALGVGLCQCFALWPGVSRAAATIAGGMMLGLDRTTAADFSFVVAIRIILAASMFDLASNWHLLGVGGLWFFTTGSVVSYMFPWLSVTVFLRLLQRTTLRPFGLYRIMAATVALAALYMERPTSKALYKRARGLESGAAQRGSALDRLTG